MNCDPFRSGEIIRRALESTGLPETVARALLPHYLMIADAIVAARESKGGRERAFPFIVGLCGCQGSGKSTMAEVLRAAFTEGANLAVAVLSLDDLYLTRAERQALARDIHPLLATRGVPGTHDIDLGCDLIARLAEAVPGEITRLPRFDKGRDERRPEPDWEAFSGPADVILFEGWCVGAVAQDPRELVVAANALERETDPDGTWRRHVNAALDGPYRRMFDSIDLLILLRAPDVTVTAAWRIEQEHNLAARLKHSGANASLLMSDAEIERFVMHYERLTRHILAEMPSRADLTLGLDANRCVVDLGCAAVNLP